MIRFIDSDIFKWDNLEEMNSGNWEVKLTIDIIFKNSSAYIRTNVKTEQWTI